jgi:hypothetical protein
VPETLSNIIFLFIYLFFFFSSTIKTKRFVFTRSEGRPVKPKYIICRIGDETSSHSHTRYVLSFGLISNHQKRCSERCTKWCKNGRRPSDVSQQEIAERARGRYPLTVAEISRKSRTPPRVARSCCSSRLRFRDFHWFSLQQSPANTQCHGVRKPYVYRLRRISLLW